MECTRPSIRKAVLFLAAVTAVLALSGCASGGPERAKKGETRFTKHYQDSLFSPTEKGLFGVEVVVAGGKLRMGLNSLDVILHDRADADVPGAKVEVSLGPLEAGHALSSRAKVIERGGGLYSALDIPVMAGGPQVLGVSISKNGLSDTATFKVEASAEEQVGGEAEGKLSDNGAFSVSYKYAEGLLPLNRIHSWELMVLDAASGAPVSDAGITIEGLMPEHGHGFPTSPQVTVELRDGVYLVEGIKFNMPGAWVVTFTIKAKNVTDTVSFDLGL